MTINTLFLIELVLHVVAFKIAWIYNEKRTIFYEVIL